MRIGRRSRDQGLLAKHRDTDKGDYTHERRATATTATSDEAETQRRRGHVTQASPSFKDKPVIIISSSEDEEQVIVISSDEDQSASSPSTRLSSESLPRVKSQPLGCRRYTAHNQSNGPSQLLPKSQQSWAEHGRQLLSVAAACRG